MPVEFFTNFPSQLSGLRTVDNPTGLIAIIAIALLADIGLPIPVVIGYDPDNDGRP